MRRFLVLLLFISILPHPSLGRTRPAPPSSAVAPIAADEPTPSPSPTPTPDVELEEKKRAAALAEEETKRLVAEQEAAEARRAKLKAETEPLGDTTKVTVPSGSVQTDEGGFVEVEMLSQEAAREIAGRVMKSLCDQTFPGRAKDKNNREFPDPLWVPTFTPQKINTLIIYDSSEVAALELYSSMLKQLKNFETEFRVKHKQTDELLKETSPEPPQAPSADSVLAAIAAPGIATGLIKSVAELINLFRTDTEFKNKKVTIPEDMVVSYLISKINTGAGCTTKPALYYPHFYPPNLESDQSDSALLKVLETIGERKGDAAEDVKKITKRIADINTLVAKLKLTRELPGQINEKIEERKKCKGEKCAELDKTIKALNESLAEAKKKINELTNDGGVYFTKIFDSKKHEDWLLKLERLKSLTQFLIDSADQVTVKLNTPDDATKLTAMAQLLRAERLREILRDPMAFTLRIAITANGTTKIKKNLFVDAKVRHTAGANLVYQLFDHNGRVRMGDALQFYFDYMSAGDVKNKVRENNPEPTETPGKTEQPKTKKNG